MRARKRSNLRRLRLEYRPDIRRTSSMNFSSKKGTAAKKRNAWRDDLDEDAGDSSKKAKADDDSLAKFKEVPLPTRGPPSKGR